MARKREDFNTAKDNRVPRLLVCQPIRVFQGEVNFSVTRCEPPQRVSPANGAKVTLSQKRRTWCVFPMHSSTPDKTSPSGGTLLAILAHRPCKRCKICLFTHLNTKGNSTTISHLVSCVGLEPTTYDLIQDQRTTRDLQMHGRSDFRGERR